MKIKILAMLMTIIILSGCAPTLVKKIDQDSNVYLLSAFGNVFVSMESLEGKIKIKADKICGAGNYDFIISPKYEIKKNTSYHNGQVMQSNAQVLRKTIQCKSKEIKGDQGVRLEWHFLKL